MRYSKEEKAMWLEDWRQSGKSAWAYAKANGLNLQTFIKWTKYETAHSFVEIQRKAVCIPAIVHPAPLPEILIEKGDAKIHIPLSINENELRAIMESLGAAL